MKRPGNDDCKGATEANPATHRVPLGGSPFFTQSVLLMIETSRTDLGLLIVRLSWALHAKRASLMPTATAAIAF